MNIILAGIVLVAVAAMTTPAEVTYSNTTEPPPMEVILIATTTDHIGEADEMVVDKTGDITLPTGLQKICTCESGGTQYEPDGTTLVGKLTPKANGTDLGICQINTRYWGEEAEELGYDLHTEDGNKRMALHIYERHGAQPWSASNYCHKQL